jgi:hypothetical protein
LGREFNIFAQLNQYLAILKKGSATKCVNTPLHPVQLVNNGLFKREN